MTALTRDELELRIGMAGMVDHLFEELDKLPSLFGGDGRSENAPVVVNSSSRALGERLIKGFISRTLGKSGIDWTIVETSLVVSPHSEGHVECRVAETLDGRREEFYFDLSRSRGEGVGLLRRAYEMLVLDGAEDRMWVVQ